MLLAYTASFGGGFSATLAAQSPGTEGASGGGTEMTGGYFNTNSGPTPGQFNSPNITFGGQRWPDIVGALHVKQGWGEAQLSGVLHDVNVTDNTFMVRSAAAPWAFGCNGSESKVGLGIDAGVKVNLPSFGAGDDFVVTGAYTQNATWYSGLRDGMWGENGATNGNGQPMYLADAYFNPITNTWAKPTAWSITGILEHHFTPQFYVNLEGSIGGLELEQPGRMHLGGCCGGVCPGGVNGVGGPLSPHAFSWIIGADLGWNPVTNLNFDLELMYQSTTQDTPNGVVGTIYGSAIRAAPALPGGLTGVFVPGAWRTTAAASLVGSASPVTSDPNPIG